MSGVFIQIIMTRTLGPVTGSNLKRWLQRENLLRSQVAQEQHKRKSSNMDGKSRVAVERRVKNMQRKEKSGKS